MFFLIGAMEARLCPLRPGWCKSDSSLPQAIHATATFPVAAAGSDLDPLAFEPHPDHSGPIRVTGRRGKRYESFCTNILFRNSNIANKRDKKNSFVWDTDLGTGYVGHKLKCKFNMDFFERREWIFWTAPINFPDSHFLNINLSFVVAIWQIRHMKCRLPSCNLTFYRGISIILSINNWVNWFHQGACQLEPLAKE